MRYRPRPLVWCVACCFALPAHAIEFRLLQDCSNPFPNPYIYYGIGDPKLSSDGRWLAMTSSTTYPPWYEFWPAVVVQDLSGSGSFYVTVPEDNGWNLGTAWSPDARYLAVGAEGYGETRGLWVLDVSAPEDPASYRHLASIPAIGGVSWSPDGTSLVFSYGGPLYRVSAAGGTPAPLGVTGEQPSCGPHDQVVYVRGNDLWIVDGSGNERRLTQTPGYESSPTWSPDGRWIAFASDRSGNYDIWVIAPTGGTAVQITHEMVNQVSPSWSTDDGLVFMSYADETQCGVWLATDLPDWTIAVERASWGAVKQLFR